ncbi:hypothetical protein GCM10027596_38940 [Nocardioides korecus]
MVEPLPPAAAAGVSRRGVLAGAGGLAAAPLLTGCSLGEVGQAVRRGAGPDTPPVPTPDVRVATRALESVRAAREQVSATAARYPGLAGTLAPLIAVHRAHEASLVDAVPRSAASPTTSPTPSPTASSTSSPTTSPSVGAASTPSPTSPRTPTVPRTRARALAAVVALEDRLHADLDGLAVRAQSGEFARLLAAMGAALAQRRAGLAR